jgi:transposase
VRHRAKLVGLRSHCKAEVHAVLAECGIQVGVSDLFGVGGSELLDRVVLPSPYAARVQSLRRLVEDLDEEIDLFARLTRGRLVADPGYLALQQLPGVGPILAAVFLVEVGEVSRFQHASQLACWAGLTPKHHESDTHVHRGRITKQGSRLVRWAAVESVKRVGPHTVIGAYKKQVADRRGKNIGTVAAARKQTEFVFYALRDHHVRALRRPTTSTAGAA